MVVVVLTHDGARGSAPAYGGQREAGHDGARAGQPGKAHPAQGSEDPDRDAVPALSALPLAGRLVGLGVGVVRSAAVTSLPTGVTSVPCANAQLSSLSPGPSRPG